MSLSDQRSLVISFGKWNLWRSSRYKICPPSFSVARMQMWRLKGHEEQVNKCDHFTSNSYSRPNQMCWEYLFPLGAYLFTLLIIHVFWLIGVLNFNAIQLISYSPIVELVFCSSSFFYLKSTKTLLWDFQKTLSDRSHLDIQFSWNLYIHIMSVRFELNFIYFLFIFFHLVNILLRISAFILID